MPAGAARFVLVEDHGLVAEALRHALSTAGHRVAQVEADDATPENVVAATGPPGATVVLDLDLGPGPDGRRRLGWTLIEPLVAAGHRVMVLTGDLDPARWGRCVSLGAVGVVTKALPLQDVADLAVAASRGEPVMSPAARQEVLRSWDSHRAERERLQAPLRRLTKREAQVLAHLVEGHSAPPSPRCPPSRRRPCGRRSVRSSTSSRWGPSFRRWPPPGGQAGRRHPRPDRPRRPRQDGRVLMQRWQDLVHPGWRDALAPVGSRLDELVAMVRHEAADGGGVLPAPDRVLRAFARPPDAVRVVLLGQDPYPTPGHAVGLSFSVEPGTRPLPRSLANVFRELVADTGARPPADGDLTPWADRGVLLLNRVLSVRPRHPGSHRGLGWEAVTDQAVRALVSRGLPLVAVLWGREAQGIRPLLGATPVVSSPHPSPLSASRGFFGSRPFSRADELLAAQGAEPLDWSLP